MSIAEALLEKGLITPGSMQEFLHSHTDVTRQPDFGEINPYALGMHMFTDIKRICDDPTDEDRQWFPDIAGAPWLETIKFAAESFKDESAILQFLSPNLIRHFRFFSLLDDDEQKEREVTAIHDDAGFRHVRKILSAQHDVSNQVPNIEISAVDWHGDRTLTLRQHVTNRRYLHEEEATAVMRHMETLWGFPVTMERECDGDSEVAFGVAQGELAFGAASKPVAAFGG